LAIPLTISSGAPFPERDLILFLTFCVILVILVP
jgi:monovalent cation/hydrogen antiporter